MSGISSSSTYSVSKSTNKGMSGMISGLDTEGLVEQMLSGTQSKIDKQQGLKWQYEQKQAIYQDIITSINSFHSKYFDTSFDSDLENNFANSDLFDSMIAKAVSGSEYLDIVATDPGAMQGDWKVTVQQLASSASLKSNVKMSGTNPSVEGSAIDLSAFEKTVTVNGVKIDLGDVSNQEELLQKMNAALSGKNISASVYDGKLRLTADDPSTIIKVKGSALGLKMTGLSEDGVTAEGIDTADPGKKVAIQTGSGSINLEAGVSFSISLDGVTKEITLNPLAKQGQELTFDDLTSKFESELKTQFGSTIQLSSGRSEAEDGSGRISFTLTPESGHHITVLMAEAKSLGFAPGATTQFSTSNQIGALNGIAGGEFRFTINGKEFKFTANDTVSSVMTAINSSGAGVKLSYSTLSDSFKLEASSSGKGYGIQIEQTQGNLLTALLGEDAVSAGSSVASRQLTSDSISAGGSFDSLVPSSGMQSVSFSLLVDGEKKTFTLSKKTGNSYYSKSDLLKFVKTSVESLGFTYDEKTNTIGNLGSHTVEFTETTADQNNEAAMEAAKKTDLALLLGFTAKYNSNITSDKAKFSAEIQSLLDAAGLTVHDDLTVTGNGAIGKIEHGRIILTTAPAVSDADPNKQEIEDALAELFGTKDIAIGDGIGGKSEDGSVVKSAYTEGTDAEFTVNGISLSRDSNSFTIEGLTLNLKKVTPADSDGAEISVSRDVDKIVDAFAAFVKDYNEMVKKLKDYVQADATYKEYAPLTSAQKAEMSDREVELWEEKAKEGLIRNDSDVTGFLSQMRLALYTKPASSKFALYDIGVETKDNIGSLSFDETELRKALSSDPESVKALFTSATDGLAAKLVKIMDDTAKLSFASPGTLVSLAGMDGYLEKANTIYWKIEDIKDKIDSLNSQYETERQRYWNQFNYMEQILSNFNNQSNYMSQMFSSY